MAAIIEQLVDLKTVKFQEVVGRLKAYEERTSLKTTNNSHDQLLLSYEGWDSRKKRENIFGRGLGNGQDTRVNPRSEKEVIHLSEKKVFPTKYESHDGGENMWYLNTGATNHMTGNKGLFSKLDTDIGGTNNIFSLGQAEEGGCVILIKHGFLYMFEVDGSLLMKVQRSPNRLYKINLDIGTPICLQVKIDDPAWLWHARLDHVNFDTIKRLGTNNLVDGVPVIDHPTQMFMHICADPYPLPPKLETGEAFEQFKKFKAIAENQYGRKIKVLRTDRGGEFTSNEFNQYCDYVGITRQLTAPYTPQQNGIIERRNRTVMSTTRSILKAMDMPQSFWAEAVCHSVYVLNRLPIKILKNQTPYKALKGRRPNIDHVRVFGCVGYVKVPPDQVKNLMTEVFL
ncbi:uncharacterized protein [Rutidosis leptorrhynchoides]|uniref:uncharacterized protein n=1 Tax=Rutidosis leptorrhynchoides TaxID=125765 RepID=UPI003A9A6447